MFKKSIYIILIQIIGIVLGFVSVFLVAGDMEPEVYAIVGIYQIVCNLSLVFTGWGIESTLTREALFWKKQGNKEKIKEYTTQALVSKLVSGIVVIPIMCIYLLLMNVAKYNGQYTQLFMCLIIGAVANILIDSMRNIVRAEGGYVFVQLMSTLNTTILKFFGIILYFNFGADCYLYFYILSSLPILFCFIIKCRKNISYKYVQMKPMLRKIWEAKYLWLKADLEYIRSNADSLLVSLLFPISIMGSYSIYKSLDQMMKNFIEGFFDVLSQHTVQYKGNANALVQQEKRIKFARNISMLGIVIGLVIYCPKMSWWIRVANLSNYEGMEMLVMCVAIGGLLYLLGKYEINAIAFLAETKMNFVLAIINAVIAIGSYLIIIVSPTINAVVVQRILNYLMTSLIAILFFRKNKETIYCKINK